MYLLDQNKTRFVFFASKVIPLNKGPGNLNLIKKFKDERKHYFIMVVLYSLILASSETSYDRIKVIY